MFNREQPQRDDRRVDQPVIHETVVKRPSTVAADPVAMNIGRSIRIKGWVTGSEDLTVDGQVEGQVELTDYTFAVGPHAVVQADIVAKNVVILGSVTGKVTAHDKVEIRAGGSLEGDIVATRIAIHDGARFSGSVEMPKAQKPEEEVPYLVAV